MRLHLLILTLTLTTNVQAQRSEEAIVLRGSDTLGAKLVPQWAEAFQKTVHPAQFGIVAEGTPTAFTALASRTTRIGMTSRPATPIELALLKDRGVKIDQIEVAREHLCVVVHKSNKIEQLSREQLRDVMTGAVTDWSQVGGTVGAINIYTRNTASGAYKDFRQMAMEGREYSSSARKMAGSGVLHEVAEDPHGITYVGLAYSRAPNVKRLLIDGVMPGEVDAAKPYPLERPLYLVVSGDAVEPERRFISFLHSAAADKIRTSAGFLPPKASAKER